MSILFAPKSVSMLFSHSGKHFLTFMLLKTMYDLIVSKDKVSEFNKWIDKWTSLPGFSSYNDTEILIVLDRIA